MRALLVYLVAFVGYIAIGVAVPEFMFTSIVAIAYVLVATWLVPSLVRRLL